MTQLKIKSSPSFEEFERHIDGVVDGLPLWRLRPQSLELVLRAAEFNRVSESESARSIDDLRGPSRNWQDSIGHLISWAYERDVPLGLGEFAAAEIPVDLRKAVTAAIDIARDWPRLQAAIFSTYRGQMTFSSSGRDVRFRSCLDSRWEFEQHRRARYLTYKGPDLRHVWGHVEIVTDWVRHVGDKRLDPPRHVVNALIRISRHIRQDATRELLLTTDLGGFTLDEAERVWDVIFGFVFLSDLLLRETKNASYTLWTPSLSRLEELLASTGVPRQRADAFLNFITFDRSRHPDPALAPLLRTTDHWLVPLTLVLMSNFERNLVRLVAQESASYGDLGKERGTRGTEQIRTLFESFPTNLVTKECRVFEGKQVVGDLDVVAIDLDARRGVIVEVKWFVEPDAENELSKAEGELRKGQRQLLRLKERLRRNPAAADWPPGWPSFDSIEWSWWVVSESYIPASHEFLSHPMRLLSWDVMFHYAARFNGLAPYITWLDQDDFLPIEGIDFEAAPVTTNFGGYRVSVDSLRPLL